MKAQLYFTNKTAEEASGEAFDRLYEQGFRGKAWIETEKCRAICCVFRRGFVRMHNRKTGERVFRKYVEIIEGREAAMWS